MENFIPRRKASQEFISWRQKLNNLEEVYTSEENFETLFSTLVEKAGEGDAIMQDVVSYYYKEGVDGWLDEDYKKSVEFEILSAANGNEFAIDKLQFFISYAYDEIIENENFPKIKYYNDIDEYNYKYIIGQKICEILVDSLKLDAKALADSKDEYRPFSQEYFRDYRRAIDLAIPVAIEKMQQKPV